MYVKGGVPPSAVLHRLHCRGCRMRPRRTRTHTGPKRGEGEGWWAQDLLLHLPSAHELILRRMSPSPCNPCNATSLHRRQLSRRTGSSAARPARSAWRLRHPDVRARPGRARHDRQPRVGQAVHVVRTHARPRGRLVGLWAGKTRPPLQPGREDPTRLLLEVAGAVRLLAPHAPPHPGGLNLNHHPCPLDYRPSCQAKPGIPGARRVAAALLGGQGSVAVAARACMPAT